MSLFSKIELPGGDKYGVRAGAIPFGRVDSTSTATVFTATVLGVTELTDGTCVMLDNGVITSAADFTLNVNGLGAKPVYSNLAAATRDTTIFNVAYTMLFVYDEERVSGGCWVCYRGYDSNTNTIGYQLRTNSTTLTASDKGYRYRLWFTSADGTKRVPANLSTSTNSTTARTLNTRPINPFGSIIYYSTNGTTNTDEELSATTQWEQYTLTIGYTYVIKLTDNKPVYVQCTPQSDGSAVMNTITQTLPSTEDGKIYIFLGYAYSTTAMELRPNHPIYYYKDGAIRLWTNAAIPAVVDTYSSTGTDAISGKGVATALETLDSSISATTGQAISAITITDGKITNSSKVSVGDVNQNAFSNVKVGNTTISADTTTDTIELVASGLVSLTPDATNDKVTISASYTETDPTVPSWAKASTKPSYTASEVGAVPTSRTINGKALSSNITLSASDVGALYWLIYNNQVIFDEVAEAISGGTNILVLYEGDTTSLTLPLCAYELTENTLYLKFTNAEVINVLGQSNINGITIEYSTSNGWSYSEVTADATVVDTYSSTSTDAISGKGVAAALGTLDSSISATTGQAISAVTITDGKITNSSKISVGDANQNAFSNIKIGSSTIAADTTTDTVELVAGGLVSLTADTTNDKVTISASYTETDPTVPSWAKEITKPQYAANEIEYDASASDKPLSDARYVDDALDITNNLLSSLESSINKVTNTLATTTKYYVTGTSSSTTNTDTQLFDTGIYSTTTAGQLNATTYKVNEQVTLQWNSTDSCLDFIFA